jgi:Catalytic LigB subunit of aromatic ring-opening dioxygenase
MGKVVMGIGVSHSPLLALDGERWEERANDDRRNEHLNTIDGRFVPYGAIAATVEDRYAEVATRDNFLKQDAAAQRALDRLGDDLAKLAPDVVVIIGDDHYELFSAANMPAISIYHGERMLTHPWPEYEAGHWRNAVAVEYAMDRIHSYPGHPELGEQLIAALIEKEFDVASGALVDDPKTQGFGHAYGFVIERLFRGRQIPVVPVLLNTYFPPNAPTPKRCYDFGVALRECIDESPLDVRVAVIGSGGLSHFVVEEELDRRIIDALLADDARTLTTLPVAALQSGSSEIRCWIAAAGAFKGLRNQWIEYIPARRTAAGTGIGLGFGAWY